MILFGLSPILVGIVLFVLGTTVGRFLNRCVVRIPQKERFWESLRHIFADERQSGVPTNQHWTKLLPFFGALSIRGRSPYSGRKILRREPWLELFNGALVTTLYFFEIPIAADVTQSCLHSPLGPSEIGTLWSEANASTMLHWRFLFHFLLVETLVVATFIDFDLFIIPDGVTLPAMAIGVLGSILFGELWLVPVWFQDVQLMESLRILLPEWMHPLTVGPAYPTWMVEYPRLHGFAASLAGFLIGGGIVWAVRIIGFWVLKQEAMGFGDVVLMAMIGSFLGWQPTVVVFFIAPAAALVVVVFTATFLRNREIPYGPYLSLGAVAILLGWPYVWAYAERLFSMGMLVPVLFAAMGILLFVTLQALQVVKRLLGIPMYEDIPQEEWTSADHLMHFAGETLDHQQGLWRHDRWNGDDAGRGRLHEEAWRHAGPSPNQHQLRKPPSR